MEYYVTSNEYSDVKPCGCRGIRICLQCVDEKPVTYNQLLPVEGGGFRCRYNFEEPPEEFLSSVNFPICGACHSSVNDAPLSCKVINLQELYPEIDGVKFPYFELLHPDILNGKIISTDEEADEDAQNISKGLEVEKYHFKKEKRETKTKIHKTDKYAKYKSRHKEHKRKIEKRKRRRSYSLSCDSSDDDWSKELHKYRKDQLSQKKRSNVGSGLLDSQLSQKDQLSPKKGSNVESGDIKLSYSQLSQKDQLSPKKGSNVESGGILSDSQLSQKDQLSQKKGSTVESGGIKLLSGFQPGSPLRSVNSEEVQIVQRAVENLPEIKNDEKVAPEASSVAQAAGVIKKEDASNSQSGFECITVSEDEIATCELPPSLVIKKEESGVKKNNINAIKLIQNYLSPSEQEDQDYAKSRHLSPVSKYESKKSRRRSFDRETEYGRDYKRPRYRSRSRETDRTSRTDEVYSNFDEYEENYEEYDDNETFYCEYCLKTMNSKRTWESHILGKKHIKAKKMANPELLASESAAPLLNADVSRRLRIKATPRGHKRVSRPWKSKIQNVVDNLIKEGKLLIGLNEVMELITPPKDYSYYCSLCDAICMANSVIGHLVSFKHKLNYLKKCNVKLYDSICFKKKQAAEPRVNNYFRQKGEDPGVIKVFEDVPAKNYHDPDLPGPSTDFPRYFSDTASVISEYSMAETIDPEIRQVEPETSKGDYYCTVCNSHMNSINMWISHVNGKRHIKNVNKAPGEAPSKVKYFKCNSPARLYDAIEEWESCEDNRNTIICGLDYICEKRLEHGGQLYNCYLCHANCTQKDMIDHLISLKHMRKYIEKEDPEAANQLTALTANMSNYNIHSLHFDTCVSLVKRNGKGTITVEVSKR